MGHVDRAAACLDSTQKTSEEWRENHCDKHGWSSTQNLHAERWEKCYFLQNKLHLSSFVMLHFTHPGKTGNIHLFHSEK